MEVDEEGRKARGKEGRRGDNMRNTDIRQQGKEEGVTYISYVGGGGGGGGVR